MAVLILLLLLLVLGLTALKWGDDSSEGFDSPEWERRRSWPPDTAGRPYRR